MSYTNYLRTLLLALILSLAACDNDEEEDGGGNTNTGGSSGVPSGDGDGDISPSTGRTFRVEPGPNATGEMVGFMIQLKPGDVLEFGCGYFELDQGLLLQATEDVLIKGCGMDKTVLSFKNSQNVTGIEALNVRGITVEDLTVLDTPGDGIKLKGVKWGTLRRVRTLWSGGGEPITADNYADRLHVACTKPPFNEGDPTPDYVPSQESGRYGIYPVESENILVEASESVGASDAGIYVGQTNNAIIRTSRAAYNVMGFEIENVQGGEYDSNLAECNTGAYLIYDLNFITQYGDTTIMHDNVSRNNNTYNFAHGGLVAAVPRGTGFITLGYDNIEMYNNVFEDHSMAAVIYTSYELIDGKGKTSDKKMDPYTEGLHIHNNVFRNSGYDIPPPNMEKVMEGEVETLLPTLVGIKNLPNGGTGAHIIWDGLLDDLDPDCPYPVDKDGNPVPAHESGKPRHTNEHPNPACHYNAYKFDAEGNRIQPDWGSCIHSNEMSDDSQAYINFHGTRGLELLIAAAEQDESVLSPEGLETAVTGIPLLIATTDLSEHDCEARFGKLLAPLPGVVIPPFERSGSVDPAPSEEQVAQLCGKALGPEEINWDALATANCPTLQQYNLFADPADPRSTPHGNGVPFVLNSKLFSDYATKYRVLFMPEGGQAVFVEGSESNPNTTLNFPVGTVLAKTFAFTDESKGTEQVVETRLLIKRQNSSGQAIWDGIAYIWEEVEGGTPVANLALGGGSVPASWHYTDVNSGELLSGSTPAYAIPNANQCLTCHSNDDQPAGSAPIGLKPRNLNRAYAPESSFLGTNGQGAFPQVNQLQYWKEQGLLAGAPDLTIDGRGVATNVEHIPKWNVPGDSGETADSAADIEARLRAYLEVNCQHCHNDRGAASNTGYYLDHFRAVDASYGICKRPTATGGGSCDRALVVVPGDADASIVACRVAEPGDPEKKMPPIARSIAHDQAAALLNLWINTVVDGSYTNAEACNTGDGGGEDPPLPLP